jgi:hypothetical protein
MGRRRASVRAEQAAGSAQGQQSDENGQRQAHQGQSRRLLEGMNAHAQELLLETQNPACAVGDRGQREAMCHAPTIDEPSSSVIPSEEGVFAGDND